MLGLQTASQTPQNMVRTGECVLNLLSSNRLLAFLAPSTVRGIGQKTLYALAGSGRPFAEAF